MESSLVANQLEDIVQNLLGNKFGDKGVIFADRVSKIAAKQGGETTAENYQLLAKRALIAFGATVIAVQVVGSIIGLVSSRKTEEQRIEKVVRRVLSEQQGSGAAI